MLRCVPAGRRPALAATAAGRHHSLGEGALVEAATSRSAGLSMVIDAGCWTGTGALLLLRFFWERRAASVRRRGLVLEPAIVYVLLRGGRG